MITNFDTECELFKHYLNDMIELIANRALIELELKKSLITETLPVHGFLIDHSPFLKMTLEFINNQIKPFEDWKENRVNCLKYLRSNEAYINYTGIPTDESDTDIDKIKWLSSLDTHLPIRPWQK